MNLPLMNPAYDGKLAHAVYRSERLKALLPTDRIGPLLAAHDRAAEMAAAASKLSTDAEDPAAKVLEALRTGEPVDVAAVIEEMARVTAARAARQEAIRFFGTLPKDAREDIRRCIDAAEDDLYAGLADQLTDVLDRAEPIVAALHGIPDAEAAIKARLADPFSELLDLTAEYADIVRAFFALLAADDSTTTSVDGTAVLFGGLAEVAPTYAAEGERIPTDRMGRSVTDLPFDVRATGSPDHFRFVVANRSRLRPRIVRADEALSTVVLTSDAVPARRVDGRLVTVLD